MKHRLKSLLLITGSFLAMCLLSGCALTQAGVSLSYVPQTDVSKVAGAEKVSVEVEVSDVRAIKDKVGAKKNGYGMEMAAIVAQEDVPETVQKANEVELENRGFHMAAGDLKVLAELNKFYNNFKIGFWAGDAMAEVTMNIQVKNAGGGIIFSKLIAGEGTKPNIQLASGNNAKVALDAALNDAIAKLFQEPAFVASLVKSVNPSNAAPKTAAAP
jgi:uncharacterized lipoprotein YajG